MVAMSERYNDGGSELYIGAGGREHDGVPVANLTSHPRAAYLFRTKIVEFWERGRDTLNDRNLVFFWSNNHRKFDIGVIRPNTENAFRR